MSSELSSQQRICPTCGSKVAADAGRCLVCGSQLGSAQKPSLPAKNIHPGRIPEITLSLPVAVLLLMVFLAIGAIFVYIALRQQPEIVIPPTVTNTITPSLTVTITPSPIPPTATYTPEPSPTPFTHLVQQNETCIGIALFYGVSVQSIVQLNNLPTACDSLYINQPLLIPQPTSTPTALPSSTLSAPEQTEAACEKIAVVVQKNDTLSGISTTYNVPMEAVREYNGLTSNTVFEGQNLMIPLCRRFATPGPTPTATLPPPYQAPALLLPTDGAAFGVNTETITLQWASVGILGENEAYMVTIEDVISGGENKLIDYVTDTKYILPTGLRPNDSVPHIFRWRVSTVRQVGTDTSGMVIYASAGATSLSRDFVWSGSETAP